MTSALASITLALFLSLSSLAVVVFRVSPLISPEYAIPFFFLCIFVVAASALALILASAKGLALLRPSPKQGSVRAEQKVRLAISSSLRQGVFFAVATCLVVLLWLLHILNWWIGVLIYVVFLLI